MRVVASTLMLIATMGATCEQSYAQAPPSATEAFNLRIRCKAMADEKAASLAWHPLTVADGAALGLSAANIAAMNREHEATYEVGQFKSFIEL